MEGAIGAYTGFTSGVVTLIQRLGLLTFPLGIAIAVVINWFGGEKAIKAVGIAILVMAVLNIVLASATGLGSWLGGLTSSAPVVAPPSGH